MRRSILKWCGNKSKVMPQINAHFDWKGAKRYVEPFSGALGSALNADVPEGVRMVLNDANWELLNLWQQVRRDAKAVERVANEFGIQEADYYEIRAWDREEDWRLKRTPLQIAARTVYLNKTCFNGIYRLNKKGHYNNPYNGRTKPIRFEEADYLASFLKEVHLRCTDWRDIVQECGEGDVIYCDPPYVNSKDPSKDFGGYIGSFSWNEQVQLRDMLVEANGRGAHVVVSNSHNDATLELYRGWNINTVVAPRSISCKSSGRGEEVELLAVLTL
jgi:DNA adenine methylase